MKKIFYSLVIISLILASACGNQKKKHKSDPALPQLSIKEQQLTAEIKIQFDSLVLSLSNLGPLPMVSDISNGEVTLTDEEKMIKPSYLLPISKASEALTLSQKYRAIVMYRIDMLVAAMYDMPTSDFQHTIAKLIIAVNNPSFTKAYSERAQTDDMEGFITKIYRAELQNGETHHYWDGAVAAIVEQLYILTQNTDKFIGSFNDKTVAELTNRISLIDQSINALAILNPDMGDICEAIKPLKKINATSVTEFRSQLMELKGEIAILRDCLI